MANIEKEHVTQVYNDIASHFSATRYKPWPVIKDFILQQTQGAIGADVGCGNGKYLGVNKDLYFIGSDKSDKLIEICNERGFEVLTCDNLSLCFRSGKVLIFVWAMEQTGKRHFIQQDNLVPWRMPTQTPGEFQTFQRFYHVFVQGELESLIQECGQRVISSGYDRDNWYAVAERIQ